MFNSVFQRRVQPLSPGEVAYLRVWLRTTSQIPAPPYVGALPPSPEQALLLLSLSYGAGVRPGELAAMRVDALLDEQGLPSQFVRIRPETTKHRYGRYKPMHPDIRLDVRSFRARHPDAQMVAFVPLPSHTVGREVMSEHGLSQWFGQLFRNAALRGLSARSGAKMFTDIQRRI